MEIDRVVRLIDVLGQRFPAGVEEREIAERLSLDHLRVKQFRLATLALREGLGALNAVGVAS
jgi:hypothetical protein